METLHFFKRYQRKGDLLPRSIQQKEWQAKKLHYCCAKSGKTKWSARKSKLLVLHWFCKGKPTNNTITYSVLSGKPKIIDSQLAYLKEKYKDFDLTLLWEFKSKKKKMHLALGLQLSGFMMKYSEIYCIIHQKYQEQYLNIKIKISGKISQVF